MEYGDVISDSMGVELTYNVKHTDRKRDTQKYTYIDNVVILYKLFRLSALDSFTILDIF